MEPIILALETSTNACSAALMIGKTQYCRFEPTQKAHTQLLLPMIDALLQEANIRRQDINAIAVGRGPGSFTGVRIAISAAQGLGFGLGIPVYPVSTLQALAYQICEESIQDNEAIIVSALDARMHEVYAGVYHFQDEKIVLLQDEILCSPQALLSSIESQTNNIIAIGSGWDEYFEEIASIAHSKHIHFLKMRQPNAKHIGLIAQILMNQGVHGVKAEDVRPVYIRDNVAVKSVVN